jgi:hypothetical protein
MLALKIIGSWVLLSCTLGPCFTWLFFYGKRHRKQAKDRRLPIGNPSSRRLRIPIEVRPHDRAAMARGIGGLY